MSKRKDKRQSQVLFEQVTQKSAPISFASESHSDAVISDETLASSQQLFSLLVTPTRRELPRMKKFRFQLLHQWLIEQVPPCRMADIGGGKGLLAYLLQQSGWSATVIDPVHQALPSKYKDISRDRQIHIDESERVPRIDQAFAPQMAQQFDLLVALHAHGCNIQLIDAAAQHNCAFIVLPCCVIGEPIIPAPGVHWIQCVVDHALSRGFTIEPFRLNFKGQNIGLFAKRKDL